MGVDKILAREHELLDLVWDGLKAVPGLHLLADTHRDRLGIVSFYIDGLHYNRAVRFLNDRHGVQVRGGCSCAGTYGHYLLNVSREKSKSITDRINAGDKTKKPGWIRLSVHPTTTDAEAHQLVAAIAAVASHHQEWAADYTYNSQTNEFTYCAETGAIGRRVHQWFDDFGRTAAIATSWEPMGLGYEI